MSSETYPNDKEHVHSAATLLHRLDDVLRCGFADNRAENCALVPSDAQGHSDTGPTRCRLDRLLLHDPTAKAIERVRAAERAVNNE